jgi:hypothetical protein
MIVIWWMYWQMVHATLTCLNKYFVCNISATCMKTWGLPSVDNNFSLDSISARWQTNTFCFVMSLWYWNLNFNQCESYVGNLDITGHEHQKLWQMLRTLWTVYITLTLTIVMKIYCLERKWQCSKLLLNKYMWKSNVTRTVTFLPLWNSKVPTLSL